MTPHLIDAVVLFGGGAALLAAGWRVDPTKFRAPATADPTPADDQEGADDAVPAEDL